MDDELTSIDILDLTVYVVGRIINSPARYSLHVFWTLLIFRVHVRKNQPQV